jgi:hypothetical protein
VSLVDGATNTHEDHLESKGGSLKNGAEVLALFLHNAQV